MDLGLLLLDRRDRRFEDLDRRQVEAAIRGHGRDARVGGGGTAGDADRRGATGRRRFERRGGRRPAGG